MKRNSGIGARAMAAITTVASIAFLAAACTTGGGGPATTTTIACTAPTQITGGNPVTTPPVPGWFSADTRSTGNVTVNATLGAPVGFGCNSAVMMTGATLSPPNASGQDKAQLFSFAKFGNTFASAGPVSYWAKRSSLSLSAAANMSLNLQLFGTAGFAPGCTVTPGLGCFATLVYEPYNQSGGQAAITNDVWQFWNATDTTPGNGVWWSSKITSGAGSQGLPQPFSFFQSLYSDATLGGYGFNVGSFNPDMVVAADGLTLGGTTTDF